MKILASLLTFVLLTQSAQAAPKTYEEVQKEATAHQEQLNIEGMGYMIGGGLGLLSSVTLGITSEEIIPKLGYSLMQTLSSASIAYGGIIYFTGDETTQEAQKLKDFAEVLGKNAAISAAHKKVILDDAAAAFAARSEYHQYRVRKIRGILEMTTAAAAGSTLALSKKSGSGSNITLSFILLISLTGGISDLMNAKDPTTPVTAAIDFAGNAPKFALTYHW